MDKIIQQLEQNMAKLKATIQGMLDQFAANIGTLQQQLEQLEQQTRLALVEYEKEQSTPAPEAPPQAPLPIVEMVGIQEEKGLIRLLYTGNAARYEFHITNGSLPYVVATDQAPPLNIQLGSPLAENLDQHSGEFTGIIKGYVIPLDEADLPGMPVQFAFPLATGTPKPTQPSPPEFPGIIKEFTIKQVYEHDINTRERERGRPAKAVAGAHPSTRTVQIKDDKARVLTGTAGHIYDPDTEEFTGQVLTGGKHNKAELSPWDLDHYYWIKDSIFRSSRAGVLFVKQRAEHEFNKGFQQIISGDGEHLLVNDKGIAGFYGYNGLKGTAFFYDALKKKFLPNSIDFDLRHAPADFCGMAGDGLILKNIKERDENWHNPFQWFPQDPNGANPPVEVKRKGMNHSASQKNLFVSTAGWFLNLPSMTPQDLNVRIDTAEHVGQIWGMPGWFCCNLKNGIVNIFNIEGDQRVIANDCKPQSYPIAFLHKGLIHLLITTNKGVFMRKFSI